MSHAAGFLPEFPAVNTMFHQQGRGHAGPARDPAGRTARFEQGQLDVPGPGNGQGLPGPVNESGADILAISVDHRSSAGQDVLAVAADNIGRGSRRGQTAELLRTDGQPVHGFKQGQTGRVRFTSAVIPGTEAGKTGADQTGFFQESFSVTTIPAHRDNEGMKAGALKTGHNRAFI